MNKFARYRQAMRTLHVILTFFFYAFVSTSCGERNSNVSETEKRKKDPEMPVRGSVVSLRNSNSLSYPTIEYNKVILFSIDPSIYNAEDTLDYFEDGELAYNRFFGGGAFVDSTGKPIHNRYKKHILNRKEVKELKAFLKQDESTENSKGTCLQTYRDVLVFYKEQKAVAQIQMCFHCSHIVFYPEDGLMGDFDSRPNFNEFKEFIGSMRFRE